MKPEAILSGLEKLYAKRKALDKQISDAEKNLAGAVKAVSKTAAKKPAGRKAGAKKAVKVKAAVKKALAPKGAPRGRKPKVPAK